MRDIRTAIYVLVTVAALLMFCVGYLAGILTTLESSKEAKQNQKIEKLQEEEQVTGLLGEENFSDWDMLQMAIIKTESDFKPRVKGVSGTGIFQATAIYVAEVNRLLGKKKYTIQDALDPVKSKEMFDVIQGTYNPGKLISKAIKLHNPDGGESYRNKVMQNLEFIRRYENIRKVIRQS